MYDFDKTVDRRHCNACKFINLPDDVTPMSVADMDFAVPPEITGALHRRIDSANYGYTMMGDEDYQAVIDWTHKRHGVVIPREHLIATPGVLNTMRCSMYAMTEPGDKVVVVLPLHTPSIRSAAMMGRCKLESWLLSDKYGNYTFDFADLEKHFSNGAKVLMLCSPHNPTGRVWRLDELEKLAALVVKYNVKVVCDEIHRDLIYPGNKHIILGNLSGMAERTVTVFSASKTFNLGGCHIGSAVIANEDLRNKIRYKLYEFGHECGRPPVFSLAAQTAAYLHGEAYLDELIKYLSGNIDLAMDYLKDLPVKCIRPEASFLLWVDCRDLDLDTQGLNELFAKAKISADPGHYYDTYQIADYKGKQHHFRLSVAMPRCQLETALKNLYNILREYK
ncbi:MAG: aminotransferase class I/II-fold pyridoxal phosphate-dependent enzyme [Lentisphaeria bacterium]|nr:aminotransferase class I/II-fold pyridoxal phosphate-dependent enzyme [Lentisphaeria bacterium]